MNRAANRTTISTSANHVAPSDSILEQNRREQGLLVSGKPRASSSMPLPRSPYEGLTTSFTRPQFKLRLCKLRGEGGRGIYVASTGYIHLSSTLVFLLERKTRPLIKMRDGRTQKLFLIQSWLNPRSTHLLRDGLVI